MKIKNRLFSSSGKKLFWLCLFCLLILESCESKEQAEYFDSLDLELWGIVQSVDMPSPYNGFGIVKVAVLKSNFKEYDPRGAKEHYYCLIKNGQAEFYQIGLSDCEIGDSIEVSTKDRIFSVHKKNGQLLEKPMILYTYDRFYSYIKKHHQKL